VVYPYQRRLTNYNQPYTEQLLKNGWFGRGRWSSEAEIRFDAFTTRGTSPTFFDSEPARPGAVNHNQINRQDAYNVAFRFPE
jgi:hypothetical protein